MIIFRTIGRISALAAAAALVAGAPAGAAAPDPTGAPAPKPAPATKSTKYCVVIETTGSHISKTVCKTRQQWIDSEGFDPVRPN